MKAHFENYFNAMDGSADWAAIEPLFNTLMHDDVVIVTAGGNKTKAEWSTAVQGLVGKGVTASNLEMTALKGDTFHYKLTLKVGDKVMTPASKATVRDGQLVRVEPVDPDVYNQIGGVGK